MSLIVHQIGVETKEAPQASKEKTTTVSRPVPVSTLASGLSSIEVAKAVTAIKNAGISATHREELEKLLGFEVGDVVVSKVMVDGVPVYLRGESHGPEDQKIVLKISSVANKGLCVLASETFSRQQAKRGYFIIDEDYREGYHYGLEDELIYMAGQCHLFQIEIQNFNLDSTLDSADAPFIFARKLAPVLGLSEGQANWRELCQQVNADKTLSYKPLVRSITKAMNDSKAIKINELIKIVADQVKGVVELKHWYDMATHLNRIAWTRACNSGHVDKKIADAAIQMSESLDSLDFPEEFVMHVERFHATLNRPIRDPIFVRHIKEIVSDMRQNGITVPLIANMGSGHIPGVLKGLLLSYKAELKG